MISVGNLQKSMTRDITEIQYLENGGNRVVTYCKTHFDKLSLPALLSVIDSGTLKECSKGHLVLVGDRHVAHI